MKVNATLSKTIEAMKNEMVSRDELNKKSKNLSSKLDQKGRTCVAVAYRLNTIEGSDIIFVLENWKVVEKGNHKIMKWFNLFYSKGENFFNINIIFVHGQKYAILYKYSIQDNIFILYINMDYLFGTLNFISN